MSNVNWISTPGGSELYEQRLNQQGGKWNCQSAHRVEAKTVQNPNGIDSMRTACVNSEAGLGDTVRDLFTASSELSETPLLHSPDVLSYTGQVGRATANFLDVIH